MVGTTGDKAGNALFEVFEDYDAFVESSWGGEVAQLQPWYKALGRYLQEFSGFFVGVDFIYVKREAEGLRHVVNQHKFEGSQYYTGD